MRGALSSFSAPRDNHLLHNYQSWNLYAHAVPCASVLVGVERMFPLIQKPEGVVLNATINHYIYASLQLNKTCGEIRLKSLDFDSMATYRSSRDLSYDGQFDLAKAVIKHFSEELMFSEPGFDITVHGDAPPGSGLGTSSTFTVALMGLFMEWRRLSMSKYDIAQTAYEIEREEVGIKGGRQDQYTAAFGGFNFMEFSGDDTVVTPLRLDPVTVNELEYNMLLCYTKGVRESQTIIKDQTANVKDDSSGAHDALDHIKELAFDMKKRLLKGQIRQFGEILHESWEHKKRMSNMISNSYIDELYSEARRLGAIGGKITGAGGGGYLLLVCPFHKTHQVRKRLVELDAHFVDFRFEPNGLQTWRAQPLTQEPTILQQSGAIRNG